MQTEENTIQIGEEDVIILTYEGKEYLNMSNAYKYVERSKPNVDQRILREYRAGKIKRYRMPGKTGYYVERNYLDHLKEVMHQAQEVAPQEVPPPTSRRAKKKVEEAEQSS